MKKLKLLFSLLSFCLFSCEAKSCNAANTYYYPTQYRIHIINSRCIYAAHYYEETTGMGIYEHSTGVLVVQDAAYNVIYRLSSGTWIVINNNYCPYRGD